MGISIIILALGAQRLIKFHLIIHGGHATLEDEGYTDTYNVLTDIMNRRVGY